MAFTFQGRILNSWYPEVTLPTPSRAWQEAVQGEAILNSQEQSEMEMPIAKEIGLGSGWTGIAGKQSYIYPPLFNKSKISGFF